VARPARCDRPVPMTKMGEEALTGRGHLATGTPGGESYSAYSVMSVAAAVAIRRASSHSG
jgi:hypothetical protein